MQERYQTYAQTDHKVNTKGNEKVENIAKQPETVKTHMLRDPCIQQVYLLKVGIIVTEKYEELPKEIQTLEEE
jgi:hypothetical protein